MKDETREWVEVAESDVQIAEIALDHELYQQVVFHCQQSVEKLLKAIWTERQGVGTHPRIHNLVRLAKDLALEIPAELRPLLVDLTDQVFPSRYPEAGRRYSRDVAEEYYNASRRFFAWLRQQLT